MPDNATGCPLQARSEQGVPAQLRHYTRQHARQNDQLCRNHRTLLNTPQVPCAPLAAPLIQPSPQPPAHFPHSMFQDPRGFLLPRFVNVGRHLMAATVTPLPTSKNLQESGHSLRRQRERRKKRKADLDVVDRLRCGNHIRLLCPSLSITITRRMDANPALAISFRTRLADMPIFSNLMNCKRSTSAAICGFLRISKPPAAASFLLYPATR
ncbi:hypothetical protein SAMN05216227_10774 [Pseudorhodobacter antarcticus]|uniref:Uncharacterized protein n=1 Tax=Pseudorhodobacter antarcticus TaxID=1077947 RepID=A0A1H8NBZ5_9RHOB|nr:hypothetical protein SAMN05216227_10774 [Pseudorhodobacter antarcticus]